MKNVMTREEVYKAIDTEREYQEQVWSNSNKMSGATNVSSFILWMERYLHQARELASTTDETPGTRSCQTITDVIRKVVALGVVCGEINGMPSRSTGTELQ